MIDAARAESIQSNLAAVRSRIERAAASAGRSPASVRLVAVSKTFSADHVRAAAAAGQREFGENKVQEALQKMPETADLDLAWHLIGHLQSNKIRKAVGPFAAIQSVDSADLLRALERAAAEREVSCPVLIQVDLAGEATKFGAAPEELASFLDLAAGCRHARVTGLMLLPPWSNDPEQTRPYFRQLRELRDGWLARGIAPELLAELSMGMSHDFEVAIEEGATIVRVGTAIFGVRKVV